MNFKTFAFITTILCSLCVSFAEAKAVRCEGLFEPSMQEVLAQLDQANNQGLFQNKTIDEFSEQFSWNRKRKIRNLVKQIQISNIPSEKAIERKVLALGELLFGKNDVVDRWILKSKAERFKESTEILAKRQLIKQGLLKTWGDVRDPKNIGSLNKALDYFWRLQNNRAFQAAQFPLRFPSWKDQKLSNELMYKIVRDGFEAHAEEARTELKYQSKIEAYNTFQRMYSPIIMGTLFVVFYQIAHEQKEAAEAQQVQQIVQEIKASRKQIRTEVLGTKEKILEKAYQAAKIDFETKWGESPTKEEEQNIKSDIKFQLFPKSA